LNKNINQLIKYYNDCKIESIILITNGLLLTKDRFLELINYGLTGVTFSLDAINKDSLYKIRRYNHKQTNKILNHFEIVSKMDIELGINCVVSKGNIYGDDIAELVKFANKYKIDFLKFSPIFNDGYVGKNAPHLILNEQDSKRIMELGELVTSSIEVTTNSKSFWSSLSSQLFGNPVLGNSCGLTTSQQIAIRGELKFCYWINDPTYGIINKTFSKIDKKIIQEKFDQNKRNCKTGMYCHCLQKMNHIWEIAK